MTVINSDANTITGTVQACDAPELPSVDAIGRINLRYG